jgi:hypothetical protein
MTMDNPADLYKLIQAGGVVATLLIVLCAAVWSGKKGIWEWGHTVTRERELQAESLRKAEDRAEKAESDRDRLHKDLEDRVIPALIKANEVASEQQKMITNLVQKQLGGSDGRH